MEPGRCANLLRSSLEGFRQREESSLRSLRPLRLSQSVHFREPYTSEVSQKASWPKFAELRHGVVRRIPLPRIRVHRVGFVGREAHVLLGRSVTFFVGALF
jgi:hypothetical protein